MEGATFVGHPYFDELRDRRVDEAFIAEHLAGTGEIVAILPGSRTQEITRNLPMMLRAAEKLAEWRPDARFVVTCLHERHRALAERILAEQKIKVAQVEVFSGKTPEVIRVARMAWAVSGSVSLELMVEALPTVIVYKVRRIDLWIAKPFIKVPYITLVNLLAGEELMPEYLTAQDVDAELAGWGRKWLSQPEEREKARRALSQLRDRVAVPGASERAAECIAGILDPHRMPLRGPHSIVSTSPDPRR